MKKSLSVIIGLVSVGVLFAACGSKKIVSDKSQNEIISENVESNNDGNLVGNIISDGKIVSNNGIYYFKNPKDDEKLYSLDKNGNVKKLSEDIFLKDMHSQDGYIYYANAGGGSDKNLYSYDISSGKKKKLTDLDFDSSDDSLMNLNSLSGGECYFSYCTGNGKAYHIAKVSTDGENLKDLFEIEADNILNNPMPSVVANRYVYYLSKDGLNCYDLKKEKNTVLVPYFECKKYMLYDGYVYYINGKKLKSIDINGKNDKVIYDGSDLGFEPDSVDFNIYKDKIYLLEKSDADKTGVLKIMDLDGHEVSNIVEGIRWFNIVNGNVFIEYFDGKDKASNEIYTYNISHNTGIGKLPNIDTDSVAKDTRAIETTVAESRVIESKDFEVAEQVGKDTKDDSYYMQKYGEVIEAYRKMKYYGKESLSDNENNYVGDYLHNSDTKSLVYDFVDLNDNGSKEMIVAEKGDNEKNIEAIYTLNGGVPEIVNRWYRNGIGYLYILDNGYILNDTGRSGTETITISKLDYNDKKVDLNTYESYDGTYDNDFKDAYYRINDVEVSSDKYRSEIGKYFDNLNDNLKKIVLNKSF